MELQQLGRGLRSRRLELGLTLAQVADKAGLSLPYIANLERGRGNPTVGVIQRVAEALGLSFETLLADGSEQAGVDQQTRLPELPASLQRFSRTRQFSEAVNEFAVQAGTAPAEMRQRVLASMASAPRRSQEEPTVEDWRRLLDAFRLILRA